MKTFDAIEQRRSVKYYNPGHQMPETDITKLLTMAMLSPTAFNIQNWRFVVVRNPALRQKIRIAARDQAQVTDTSLFIVLCADLKAWEKQPIRYWANADKETQDYIIPAIDAYYRGKDQVQRDEAMRSCGIAAQTLMLASKSLGYDSCPMDGFDFIEVAKLINLPEDHVIAVFVAIGEKTKDTWPRPGQLTMKDVVITDQFEKLT